MKKWGCWLVYPFLAASVIMSFIALCRTCPRNGENISFDYMGIIVMIIYKQNKHKTIS